MTRSIFLEVETLNEKLADKSSNFFSSAIKGVVNAKKETEEINRLAAENERITLQLNQLKKEASEKVFSLLQIYTRSINTFHNFLSFFLSFFLLMV